MLVPVLAVVLEARLCSNVDGLCREIILTRSRAVVIVEMVPGGLGLVYFFKRFISFENKEKMFLNK